MSGHSKWSKVKHQKESTDAIKGKIFTKMSNAIIIAVKDAGGGIEAATDPNSNFKLRLLIEKAKSYNMPKENILRAIERAKGYLSSSGFEEGVYEGFGPNGVGLIIQIATDNKQRTVSELKNILERSGGVLATSGAVMPLFNHIGLIKIPSNTIDKDDLIQKVLDAGGDDVIKVDDCYEVYTKSANLHLVKNHLLDSNLQITDCELIYSPKAKMPIDDRAKLIILNLISKLEECDDVQKIYSNAEI